MLGKGLPNAGIVYRNVVVISIHREDNGNLRLWGIHNKRDYLDILYEDVLYSQIDETNVRLHVSLVEELTLDELSELRHNMGRNRMLREVPERFSEFINALSREEYRIYAHYTIKRIKPGGPRTNLMEERLVIARGIQVENPEERAARNAIENREYRFYAFVTHAEGGKDEKWARWIQRKLTKCRIPIQAVSKLRAEEGAPPEPIPGQFNVTRGNIPSEGVTSSVKTKNPSDLARYLIVICSPRGARSERVERDVGDFMTSGKENYIIPFIISGEPVGKAVALFHESHESEEDCCYPPSLSVNILGVSLFDGSREETFIRIIARLLRVKFSRLYQRHLREQRRFIIRTLAAASALLLVLAGLTVWAVSNEIEAARRQKEADGLARFLVEEMRNEPRLPKGVRVMIDEKIKGNNQ
jgi:hypothetical protein